MTARHSIPWRTHSRWVAAVALIAFMGGLLWAMRETPDQRLLRRWLSAQARGSIPAGLYRELDAVSPEFRVLAAREIGRHEGVAPRWWRSLRPRLPGVLRARAPLPFSEGRRGLALLNLVQGHEREPGVAAALVGVVTNRTAANRRIALLALGNLDSVSPPLAESLAVVADDADYRLRLEVAGPLQQAWPRTRPVELALRRLAADPVALVREAARDEALEEPETYTR